MICLHEKAPCRGGFHGRDLRQKYTAQGAALPGGYEGGFDGEMEFDMSLFQPRMAAGDKGRRSGVRRGEIFDMNSSAFKAHLLLSVGKYTFVMLPVAGNGKQIVPGHCLLVPRSRATSLATVSGTSGAGGRFTTSCIDANVCVKGKMAVFMERGHSSQSASWSYLSCIPLDSEMAASIPMFFQSALNESAGDWSANKSSSSKKEVGPEGIFRKGCHTSR